MTIEKAASTSCKSRFQSIYTFTSFLFTNGKLNCISFLFNLSQSSLRKSRERHLRWINMGAVRSPYLTYIDVKVIRRYCWCGIDSDHDVLAGSGAYYLKYSSRGRHWVPIDVWKGSILCKSFRTIFWDLNRGILFSFWFCKLFGRVAIACMYRNSCPAPTLKMQIRCHIPYLHLCSLLLVNIHYRHQRVRVPLTCNP